ncbi:hypothetical protein M3Y95_00603000 [Aphelenchoides besseyi]|nr:hypothetical protein M3Y95_00603000 [Aphelenchoides besseyi]
MSSYQCPCGKRLVGRGYTHLNECPDYVSMRASNSCNNTCFLIRLFKSITVASVNKTHETEAYRSALLVIDHLLQKKFNWRLKVIGEEEKTSKVPTVVLNVSSEVLQSNRGRRGHLCGSTQFAFRVCKATRRNLPCCNKLLF